MTQTITESHAISTRDGTMPATVHRPAGPATFPAVLFYMDGMGIRPALQDMASRLAAAGYYVLLPNLYYRSGPWTPLNVEKDRDKMSVLFKALDHEKVASDTDAGLTFLDTAPQAKASRMGCHGYCMGGGFALAAAGHHPDRVAAAASFHGARLVTDAPDSPHRLLPKVKARLYFGVAGIDPFLAPDETRDLKAALDTAGTRYTLDMYEGVQHGFAVPGLPSYDKAASERHWENLLALYRDNL